MASYQLILKYAEFERMVQYFGRTVYQLHCDMLQLVAANPEILFSRSSAGRDRWLKTYVGIDNGATRIVDVLIGSCERYQLLTAEEHQLLGPLVESYGKLQDSLEAQREFLQSCTKQQQAAIRCSPVYVRDERHRFLPRSPPRDAARGLSERQLMQGRVSVCMGRLVVFLYCGLAYDLGLGKRIHYYTLKL